MTPPDMPDRRRFLQRLGAIAPGIGWRAVAGAGVSHILTGCSPHPDRQAWCSHDFYVWQRIWTDPLRTALRQAAGHVQQWRILTMQIGGSGESRTTQAIDVDWAAVAATGRPVRAVVRIDGTATPLALLREQRSPLIDHLGWLIDTAQRHRVAFSGLEIDHDCPTRRLAVHAELLQALRDVMPPSLTLSITALPTWLEAAHDLSAVLRVADESVLQVHGVQRPVEGLFDADTALRWAHQWSKAARIVERPFRLALPCYASRVVLDEQGGTVAVESETPVPVRSNQETTLTASPGELSRLLQALRDQPPDALRGCVWFRLPTATDQRAWRWGTWQAVTRAEENSRWVAAAHLRPAGADGLFDVVLTNDGETDLDLPPTIALPSSHSVGRTQANLQFDGLHGYAADLLDPAGPRLRCRQLGWLRPHSSIVVGWVRLPAQQVSQSTGPLPLRRSAPPPRRV